MTKVCGCGESEKAYAIINPDSVDRKEILSLNPPICYQIRSNALLIDGDILIGNKELAPVAPYSLVQDSSLNTHFSGGQCEGQTYFVFLYSIVGTSNFSDLVIVQGKILGTTINWNGTPEDPRPFGILHVSPQANAPDGQIIRGRNINLTDFGIEGVFSQTPDHCGDPEPAGGCTLILNYFDSTTTSQSFANTCPESIIPINNLEIIDSSGVLYNFAPYEGDVIRLQCDVRQCPPETCCNPCAGSAFNCCYDENGTLIDSFIRRV